MLSFDLLCVNSMEGRDMTQASKSQTGSQQMQSGEDDYALAIDEIIGRAQRSLHIFDVNLMHGNYSSVRRAEVLYDFLARRRGNRVLMILHQTDFLLTRCPRLMSHIKIYGHAFSVYQTAEHAHVAADPFIIADDGHYVHRFHNDGARFLIGISDFDGTRQLEERFQQLLEASSPAVAATKLGL